MTRRIALAILATVWTLLVLGGIAAYLATRSVLIADLDAALLARATAQAASSVGLTTPVTDPDDRFRFSDAANRPLPRTAFATDDAPRPIFTVTRAAFVRTDAGGPRHRTLELRPDAATLQAQPDLPAVIVFSGSAAALDAVLARLATTLATVALLTGAAAALVATTVARRSLHPLHTATETLGQIDERRLDRRIDTAALPPELRPIADQLNTMLARLHASFTARRQFLADASHELRTPVAALLTTLEVARRRPRAVEELTATLDACLTDARLLRRLVDSLLTQARADNPARNEPAEDTDLSALLAECATVARGLAADRDVTVRAEIPPGLRLTTHPHRLRSVVTNLLSNAVDYNNPGGSVTLTAIVETAPGRQENPDGASLNPPTQHPALSTQHFRIEISDTGPGIPADALPHIFEPFFRATPAAKSRTDHDHLGLGLFLVKSHVTALGGAITVVSTPGTGTRFTVTLPSPITPASPSRTPSETPLIPFSPQSSILLHTGPDERGPTS